MFVPDFFQYFIDDRMNSISICLSLSVCLFLSLSFSGSISDVSIYFCLYIHIPIIIFSSSWPSVFFASSRSVSLIFLSFFKEKKRQRERQIESAVHSHSRRSFALLLSPLSLCVVHHNWHENVPLIVEELDTREEFFDDHWHIDAHHKLFKH